MQKSNRALLARISLLIIVAFASAIGLGKTLAPGSPVTLDTLDYRVEATVWLDQLKYPWALEFIDRDTALVSEIGGNLLLVKNGKKPDQPVAGTPAVFRSGQGGLMDVALAPAFDRNGWVYLAYSHRLEGAKSGDDRAMTRIVRGHIRDNTWVDQEVLFEARPEHYLDSGIHFGSRLQFDRDGLLYFSIGERGRAQQAQDITRPNGKIHRIHADGSIPKDNPFVDSPGAYPSIFSYGNRNPQGLALHPVTGALWEAEHGPRGGDELNLIEAGRNYGWPAITYGIDYSGKPVSEFVSLPGMEQPVLYWRPSIATCAIDFYTGSLFPKWRNRLLVSALGFQELRLLTIDRDRVLHQEILMKDLGRVRDVKTGPDGAIYAVLNAPDSIIRLTPRE